VPTSGQAANRPLDAADRHRLHEVLVEPGVAAPPPVVRVVAARERDVAAAESDTAPAAGTPRTFVLGWRLMADSDVRSPILVADPGPRAMRQRSA
jgi:hypothetical protein